MLKKLLSKFRLRLINKKYLEDIHTRRKYLLKILSYLDLDYLLPDEDNKYIKIDSFFPNIVKYNDFILNRFLSYDLTKPLSKSLYNNNIYSIYYIDFFNNDHELIDVKNELKLFVESYKELVGLLEYFDINNCGIMFLNFKILNYYLSNMEEILIKIISSKL